MIRCSDYHSRAPLQHFRNIAAWILRKSLWCRPMKEAKEFHSRICTVSEEEEGVFFVFHAASLSLIFAFRCTAKKHPERTDLLFSLQLFTTLSFFCRLDLFPPSFVLRPRHRRPLEKEASTSAQQRRFFPDIQYIRTLACKLASIFIWGVFIERRNDNLAFFIRSIRVRGA